jgi:hypothetical protein
MVTLWMDVLALVYRIMYLNYEGATKGMDIEIKMTSPKIIHVLNILVETNSEIVKGYPTLIVVFSTATA